MRTISYVKTSSPLLVNKHISSCRRGLVPFHWKGFCLLDLHFIIMKLTFNKRNSHIILIRIGMTKRELPCP